MPDCGEQTETWVAAQVYCTCCGYDWTAVYVKRNTFHLECPVCRTYRRFGIVPREV